MLTMSFQQYDEFMKSHQLSTNKEMTAEVKRVVKKGRIRQSASRWCYRKLSLEQLCEAGAKMGLKGIDLLRPNDFPTLKKHGLVCTMTSGGGGS